MGTLEIWLLAVSLAIDCFTVSVTSGIILAVSNGGLIFKNGFFLRVSFKP